MTKRFSHFFILIAFLAGIIAPACGFSWNGKYSLVEICTTEGIEMKVVNNGSTPTSPSDQTHKDECPFCFQNNHVMAHLTEAYILSSQEFTLTKKIINSHDILYRQILSQYHSARAPPSYI